MRIFGMRGYSYRFRALPKAAETEITRRLNPAPPVAAAGVPESFRTCSPSETVRTGYGVAIAQIALPVRFRANYALLGESRR
jgi:hypothetical protein